MPLPDSVRAAIGDWEPVFPNNLEFNPTDTSCTGTFLRFEYASVGAPIPPECDNEDPEADPDGCSVAAMYARPQKDGSYQGTISRIWMDDNSGLDQRALAAHELGHVYGLDEAYLHDGEDDFQDCGPSTSAASIMDGIGCDAGVVGPTARDYMAVQDLYALRPPWAPTTIFNAGPDIAVRFRDDNAAEEGYGVIVERWTLGGWAPAGDSRFLTNSIAPCTAIPCGQTRTVYYRKPAGLPDGNYRLCLYQTSDLYPSTDSVCAASRTLRSNLAFDSDGDGFSDRNEGETPTSGRQGGTPLCQDGLNADPTDDNRMDDGCPAHGGLREIDAEPPGASPECDNVANDDGVPPVADDSFVNDGCDPRGFHSEATFKIGTNPRRACPPGDDSWPADINRDGFADIFDIVRVTGSFGKAITDLPTPSPPNPPLTRLNIGPAQLDRFIDIFDVIMITRDFGLDCHELPAPIPDLAFASGTYTGDGVDGRQIPVGFRPKFVVVKVDHYYGEPERRLANSYAMMRSDTMTKARNVTIGGQDQGISGLNANGFTVDFIETNDVDLPPNAVPLINTVLPVQAA